VLEVGVIPCLLTTAMHLGWGQISTRCLNAVLSCTLMTIDDTVMWWAGSQARLRLLFKVAGCRRRLASVVSYAGIPA
jgi:hypothetical protein